jgi:hypothetical protein
VPTIALACLLLFASARPVRAQVPVDGSWQLVTDAAAFSPRDCGGALVFHDRMWLLGGWHPRDDPTTNSEVWSSADGLDWRLEVVAPWEGRHCAGYAVHRDQMWIIGGDNNRYHYQNDVWSSPDGVVWTEVASDVPWRDRVTHHVVAYDDRLWVLGGQQITDFDPAGGKAVYNDVWSSEDGATWTRVTEHAPWSPRGQILGAVVFDGKMWVVGGGTYNEPRKYYNDLWSSADGVQWERAPGRPPWGPREYHNVTVFDGRMWVLAGYREANLDDVWSSADGTHWRQLVTTPWGSRHAGHVFVFADALWMVAGSVGLPVNDVWKVDRMPPLTCDPVPRAGCAPATSPGGSSLKLLDQTPDAGDAVTWRWRGDAGTDFGLPPGDTSLALCLYSGAASPRMIGGALAAGLCTGKSCWSYTANGFKYRDPQLFAAGTKTLVLANGGGARVVLRGKSGLVGVPPLGALALPLTVQLQGTNNGCWEARYSSAGVRRHTATRFQGKSD